MPFSSLLKGCLLKELKSLGLGEQPGMGGGEASGDKVALNRHKCWGKEVRGQQEEKGCRHYSAKTTYGGPNLRWDQTKSFH